MQREFTHASACKPPPPPPPRRRAITAPRVPPSEHTPLQPRVDPRLPRKPNHCTLQPATPVLPQPDPPREAGGELPHPTAQLDRQTPFRTSPHSRPLHARHTPALCARRSPSLVLRPVRQEPPSGLRASCGVPTAPSRQDLRRPRTTLEPLAPIARRTHAKTSPQSDPTAARTSVPAPRRGRAPRASRRTTRPGANGRRGLRGTRHQTDPNDGRTKRRGTPRAQRQRPVHRQGLHRGGEAARPGKGPRAGKGLGPRKTGRLAMALGQTHPDLNPETTTVRETGTPAALGDARSGAAPRGPSGAAREESASARRGRRGKWERKSEGRAKRGKRERRAWA